jgi:hypothetical protein
MKTVDGQLMIEAVQEYKLEPTGEDAPSLRAEATNLYNLSKRYSRAGFGAMGDKQSAIADSLVKEAQTIEKVDEALTWREQGKFVLSEPKWDSHIYVDSVYVPFKFISEKGQWAKFTDYQALYKVDIQNWVGDVPIQVLEAVEEFKSKFNELSIWFVARRSAVENLVKNFVKQDPILVGRIGWNLDEANYVVLKMWGDDLEELSLALIDPTLEVNL